MSVSPSALPPWGLIGVLLGGAISIGQQELAWRRQRADQREERERRAAKQDRLFRIESDAASFGRLRPLLDELEHEWNLLGGGPGPEAGAVGVPGDGFNRAAGAFETAFYQVVFLDPTATETVTAIFRCLRNFGVHSWSLAVYQRHPTTYAKEILEEQTIRKDLTGEFRTLYTDLIRHMTAYVGQHRVAPR